MKTLIIYTHPSPTGFNAAILKEVQSNLSKKHEVKTLDLYAENFDPILRFDQEHRRRDLHKDPEMAKYQDLITWADHLISFSLSGGAVCRPFSKALSIVSLRLTLPTLIRKSACKVTCKASLPGLSSATIHQVCSAFRPRLWQGT